ncbi:MAG: hypothetical protein ACPHQP_07235 [Longimicrobiales bacterium]
MTPLVLLVAAGLGVSAWFKARTTARLGMGLSPLVLLEGLVALALVGTRLPGLFGGAAVTRGSVAIAIVVMLTATFDHARRLRRRRHRRELTEGGRLAAYMNVHGVVPGESSPPDDEGRPAL